MIEDDDLLEKCKTIWDKGSADIKKKLIASLPIKKKFENLYDKETPMGHSNHTCLAVISLAAALKKEDNYCLEVFLKECKYIEK